MTAQVLDGLSAGSLVVSVVTALLGGGLIAAVASLITGRALARKTTSESKSLEAKLPAEVDSVVVQGAEQAVLTMQRALDSATNRISQLEEEKARDRIEREEDRSRIASLEKRVRDLQGKVNAAEREVARAKAAGNVIRDELDAFIREQNRRD